MKSLLQNYVVLQKQWRSAGDLVTFVNFWGKNPLQLLMALVSLDKFCYEDCLFLEDFQVVELLR